MVCVSVYCILSQGMLSIFYVCLLYVYCIKCVFCLCIFYVHVWDVYPCMFDVATCVYVPQYSCSGMLVV